MSARRSQTSSPRPGHDVERVAGVQHGRHRGQVIGAVRRVARRDRLRGAGERQQRVAAAVGRRARVRGAALARATRIVPAALRRTTTPSSPSAVSSPASKHRHASQPAKRSTCANGAGPPLLVADEQQRGLGEVAAPRRRARAARRARARRRPSCRPRPSRAAGRRRAAAACGASCAITVSTWPSSRMRRAPVPRTRASRSGAWPGDEHGGRSTSASAGQQRGARRRRTPRRRARRRTARRPRRAPPARARRAARSPPPRAGPRHA